MLPPAGKPQSTNGLRPRLAARTPRHLRHSIFVMGIFNEHPKPMMLPLAILMVWATCPEVLAYDILTIFDVRCLLLGGLLTN